ncbi:MAG: heavy metal-associated domain-containing protein [Methylococcales bacterium]
MSQRTVLLPISGMHCASCEAVINISVKELPGVVSVRADRSANKVQVSFDDTLISAPAILTVIEKRGYFFSCTEETGK